MPGPYTRLASIANANATQDIALPVLESCYDGARFVVDLKSGTGVQSWTVRFKKTLDSGAQITLATAVIAGTGVTHATLDAPFDGPKEPVPIPDTISLTRVSGTASFDFYAFYGN